MTRKPSTSSSSKETGYQVWHFALAVPAIAITLQVFLGSLTPLPKEHNPYAAHYAAALPEYEALYQEYLEQKMPDVGILPVNLRGEMTGPLLASVLKEYFPESTTQQASDLRDTLPPGHNPRMIVIMPKDDDGQPVF